ncbi:MAG: ABC transporter permease [Nocardioides sp.]
MNPVNGPRRPADSGLVGSLRSLASAAAVIVAATLLTFSMVRVAPGDVATSIAVRQAGPGATQEQVQRIRRELRLDEPILVSYGTWLGNAATGDLGRSERTGRPVADELAEKLPRTLFLAVGSSVLAIITGFGIGVAAAQSRGRWAGALLRVVPLVGVSVPSFWLSYLLILLFTERLGWLPTSGVAGPRSWLMPWLVLAIPAAGAISRVTAVTLREALSQPYVTAARARGASRRSLVLREGLPNIVGPVLNVIGLQIGALLTGSVIVETVFAWPGVGAWFVDSVKFRDNWSILAGVLVFVLAYIGVTRLVDVIQFAVDPRLRRQAGR